MKTTIMFGVMIFCQVTWAESAFESVRQLYLSSSGPTSPSEIAAAVSKIEGCATVNSIGPNAVDGSRKLVNLLYQLPAQGPLIPGKTLYFLAMQNSSARLPQLSELNTKPYHALYAGAELQLKTFEISEELDVDGGVSCDEPVFPLYPYASADTLIVNRKRPLPWYPLPPAPVKDRKTGRCRVGRIMTLSPVAFSVRISSDFASFKFNDKSYGYCWPK